jgi:putative polyketide hydroxylase
MHDLETFEVSVLVVGGGPAGLTAAGALSRLGVDCLVAERRDSLSALPRATSVSTRSMEILRSWELEDEVRAGGVDDVEWLMLSCETLADAAHARAVPIGLPTREQSLVISPTSPACVPQDHLEPVLLAHARANGARVELGVEMTGVQQVGDGVRASLRDVATGRERRVRARYLIGADGAHGPVRTELGIPAQGLDGLGEAVSAVFDAPLWPLLGERRYGIYDINHPDARGVLLPAGRGDRWLYGVVWWPGEDAPAADTDWFMRRIRLLAGAPDLPVTIERTGRFRFSTLLADRFREGSAFLMGDAAHRVTPRGGTGMNTAIHDGYDLGWKLGWVLRGWASPALLDTYELERRPVAEHNMIRSADPAGSMRNADLALHADLGGRIPHVRVQTEAGPISTLDLLGPGLTVFMGPDGGPWEAPDGVASDRIPVAVHRLDPIAARALGLRGGDALVVRPDGTSAAAAARAQPQAAAA